MELIIEIVSGGQAKRLSAFVFFFTKFAWIRKNAKFQPAHRRLKFQRKARLQRACACQTNCFCKLVVFYCDKQKQRWKLLHLKNLCKFIDRTRRLPTWFWLCGICHCENNATFMRSRLVDCCLRVDKSRTFLMVCCLKNSSNDAVRRSDVTVSKLRNQRFSLARRRERVYFSHSGRQAECARCFQRPLFRQARHMRARERPHQSRADDTGCDSLQKTNEPFIRGARWINAESCDPGDFAESLR